MHGKDFTRYDAVNDKKVDYNSWILEVVNECIRVTKKHVFFNIQMLANNKESVINILTSFKPYLKDIIIWQKTQAPPAIEPGVMNTAYEFIIIFSNDQPDKRKFYGSNFHGNFNNVIKGNNASQNEYAKIHKATFPLYLPETLISKFTKEGEVILDPFSGTGTTCLAAKNLKRKFIGIDISEQYNKIANERLRQDLLF